MSRPEAMTFAMMADDAGLLSAESMRLTVFCDVCATRLGQVHRTQHGHLWLGFLGSNRNGRAVRRSVFRRSGQDSDGRVMIAQWVEDWRTYYICDCKCRRNSVDGPTIHAALLAGQRKVDAPAQK